MTHIIRLLVVLVALVALPAQGWAASVLQMGPTTSWAIDETGETCAVQRWFKGDKTTLMVDLRQFNPADRIQITLASDAFEKLKRFEPQLRFAPDPEWQDFAYPQIGQLANGMTALAVSDTLGLNADEAAARKLVATQKPSGAVSNVISPVDRDAREKSITGLEVNKLLSSTIVIDLGDMHAVAGALRACTDRLVKTWGLDPEVESHLTKRPWPKNFDKFAREIQSKYPVDKMGAYWNATVRIRMGVDATGEPTTCRAQLPIVIPEFEETACKILIKQARFDPALDAAGKPVRSYWSTTIIYVASQG